MRPPLNAGENKRELARGRPQRVTSMRPPLNAGENWAHYAKARRKKVSLQ